MARKRMIDPGIWTSLDFGHLSPLAQIYLIGCMSNADDEGRFAASPEYLRAVIRPYGPEDYDTTTRALQEVFDSSIVVVYEVNGRSYGVFSKWLKYQKIQKPTPSKLPPQTTPTVALQEDYRRTTIPLSPKGREGKGVEGNGMEEKRGVVVPPKLVPSSAASKPNDGEQPKDPPAPVKESFAPVTPRSRLSVIPPTANSGDGGYPKDPPAPVDELIRIFQHHGGRAAFTPAQQAGKKIPEIRNNAEHLIASVGFAEAKNLVIEICGRFIAGHDPLGSLHAALSMIAKNRRDNESGNRYQEPQQTEEEKTAHRERILAMVKALEERTKLPEEKEGET